MDITDNKNMIREFRHPQINHTFQIKDINMFEIEIDGVRVHRNDCDWLVRTSNHCQYKNDITIHDLSLQLLQSIISLKN